MKSNMRTRNNEILEKINILTKDVILSKTLNNEVNHENIINQKVNSTNKIILNKNKNNNRNNKKKK